MATRASSSLLALLKDTVATIAEPMPGVTMKRMFGSDVWLVNGSLFALSMGYGRIVVRLPVSSGELLAIDGAGPWVYGTRSPAHWVMVPEDFHDDVDRLSDWMRRACSEVVARPPKKTAPKKTAPKKTASKTPTRTRS